jgi:hypothetical protein
MSGSILVLGVPFLRLFHRDGRLIRAPGLFGFARREGPRCVLLHLELAEAINLRAVPMHPRWPWAMREGLNELLVCLASARASAIEEDADNEVVWHPEAEAWFAEERVSHDGLVNLDDFPRADGELKRSPARR